MFENLKAFIRHGKHANDFRRNKSKIDEDSERASEAAERYEAENSNLGVSSGVTLNNDGLNTSPNIKSVDTLPKSPLSWEDHKEESDKDKNLRAAARIVEQEKQIQRYNDKALENFEFMEALGEGAFSVVYKAKDLRNGKLIAIKVVRKFQMDQTQKQSVYKEAVIMRKLRHRNIVNFIDFIDTPDHCYIVQELLTGGEVFAAIIKYTYLSEDLARHIIVQITEAVKYLHEEVGVVHRDIKPENFLYEPIEFFPSIDLPSKLRQSDDPMTKQDEGEFICGVGGGGIGTVKLADFGLSKQVWEYNTKTPCGTVGYTAPEIIKDERYSREVDMWALGCVLYTLLCGFPPFYDENIQVFTEKVAKGQYTFLEPWWDEVSDGAKNCVSRLLTVNRSERYTAGELLNDPWILEFRRANESGNKDGFPNNLPAPRSIDPNGFMSNPLMYSPAAVTLREAFDVTSAIHRMEEETIRENVGNLTELIEEEEDEVKHVEEKVGNSGIPFKYEIDKNRQAPRHRKKKLENADSSNPFSLNLAGSSILERRKKK